MSLPFDRASLVSLLTDLAGELERRGARGEVLLVGGAAMVLAYDAARATRDVDAVFEPKQTVYEAAAAVARRRGLADGWLNDAVKGFMHGDDANAARYLDLPGLRIDVASPEYLLAMKIFAGRAEIDADDIRLLYPLCGFTTAQQGLDLVEREYPGRPIPPRVRFMLEEMFPPRGRAGAD
jgi:hypothetical protein